MYTDRTNEFRSLCSRKPSRRLPKPSKIESALATFDTLPYEQACRVLAAQLESSRLDARNDEARLHWCEAERLFRAQTRVARAPVQSCTRNDTLGKLQHQLEVVSSLYETVTTLVANQSNTISTIERNVDSINIRIDAARDELFDAAPREYRRHKWRWYQPYMPRGLAGRLRCILLTILCLNFVFVYVILL